MLYLQILSVIATAVFGIWTVGAFLASNLIPSARSISVLGPNVVLGVPVLALALWLPFAYGWL